MKFLVVEDGFLNRHHLCNLLSPFGHIDVAVNGHEAVDAVNMALGQNEPYDLICLDIMMPGMDGHDALKHIREMEEKTGKGPGQGMKILMTTASDDRKNVMKAFRDQCDGYLIKPIQEEALLEAIQEVGLTVG